MRLIACRELGFRCAFVAQGRTPGDADRDFWLHARTAHGHQLKRLSVEQKADLSQLVEDLAESERLQAVVNHTPRLAPAHSPIAVRRWWR